MSTGSRGTARTAATSTPAAPRTAAARSPAASGRRAEALAGRRAGELEETVRRHDVAIGVIATPAVAAQDVADRMVAIGITSILNFAPAVLAVPEGVDVRKVDLSIELQILAYHEQRKANGAEPGPAVAAADGGAA